MIPPEVVNLPCSQKPQGAVDYAAVVFPQPILQCVVEKPRYTAACEGCIQKLSTLCTKVIPRYPVESPVDKVDSQFLRQVFTAVSCGAGMRAKTWLSGSPYPAVGTRVDTKVSTLVNPVSFIPNLAKIGERRLLRKRERQRIFFFRMDARCAPCIHIFAGSDTFLLHRRVTLSRVRHNSAARFVSEL